MSGETIKAKLVAVLRDRADEAENRLWLEGWCGAVGRSPRRLIDSAFGAWHSRLREASEFDPKHPNGQWWTEILGTYGKKNIPLTRALLASRKRPRGWSLSG